MGQQIDYAKVWMHVAESFVQLVDLRRNLIDEEKWFNEACKRIGEPEIERKIVYGAMVAFTFFGPTAGLRRVVKEIDSWRAGGPGVPDEMPFYWYVQRANRGVFVHFTRLTQKEWKNRLQNEIVQTYTAGGPVGPLSRGGRLDFLVR